MNRDRAQHTGPIGIWIPVAIAVTVAYVTWYVAMDVGEQINEAAVSDAEVIEVCGLGCGIKSVADLWLPVVIVLTAAAVLVFGCRFVAWYDDYAASLWWDDTPPGSASSFGVVRYTHREAVDERVGEPCVVCGTLTAGGERVEYGKALVFAGVPLELDGGANEYCPDCAGQEVTVA